MTDFEHRIATAAALLVAAFSGYALVSALYKKRAAETRRASGKGAEPSGSHAPEPPSAPAGPERRLVAQVELGFADGSDRVGVRPGTRSHTEFMRLAEAMWDDLGAARRGEEAHRA